MHFHDGYDLTIFANILGRKWCHVKKNDGIDHNSLPYVISVLSFVPQARGWESILAIDLHECGLMFTEAG